MSAPEEETRTSQAAKAKATRQKEPRQGHGQRDVVAGYRSDEIGAFYPICYPDRYPDGAKSLISLEGHSALWQHVTDFRRSRRRHFPPTIAAVPGPDQGDHATTPPP